MYKDIRCNIIYNRGKLETKSIVYIGQINYGKVLYLNVILPLEHLFIGTCLKYSVKALKI